MARLIEPNDLGLHLDGVEVIETVEGGRQVLQLLRHPKLGRIFTIDGVVQHVEAWQALYHEPLVHLAAAFVSEVRSALVLGGGSLFAASELLKYPSIRRCVLVDHDASVLELMTRHYAHAKGVIADERFIYIEAEARSHLDGDTESFDLIVNDALDLTQGLPAGDFERLSGRLNPGGVCSDVIYRHVLEGDHIAATKLALDRMGGSAISLVIVPEYPGVLHALTIWGSAQVKQDLKDPLNSIQIQWCADGGRSDLEFYDPRFLSFHLYRPPLLRRVWN